MSKILTDAQTLTDTQNPEVGFLTDLVNLFLEDEILTDTETLADRLDAIETAEFLTELENEDDFEIMSGKTLTVAEY